MEEGSKVRLVRCPKCENLLPELPDFSVYQCGGCGAVLRAKSKGIQEGETSGKSDNANEDMGKSDKLGKDIESDPKSVDQLAGIKIDDERAVCNGSNVDNRGVFANSYADRNGKEESNRSKNPKLGVDSPELNNLRTDRMVRSHQLHSNGSAASQGQFGNFHYGEELDGISRVERSEPPARADLLRRIDELKDQLSRSSGKQQKVSFVGSSSDSNVRIRQHHHPFAYGDDHHHRQFLNRSNEPYFVPSHPTMDMYGWERQTQYGDSYNRAETIPRNYTHQPYHRGFNSYYEDLSFHRRENLFHQPACSCAQCCKKSSYFPHGIDRLASHSRRNDGINNNRRSNLLRPQPWSNPWDFDSENEGCFLNYHRPPRRFAAGRMGGQETRPIAGGAPFITCKNCFELLKLPAKQRFEGRNKIKCGACASVISFESGGNIEVISSISVDAEAVPSETGDERCSNFSNVSDAKSEFDEGSSPFFEKKTNSSTSGEEKIPEVKRKNGGSSLSEVPPEAIDSLLQPSDRCDNGNRSARSERERVSSLGRNTSSKDAEEDMPLHEISNNRSNGGNKTGKSFLAGLIKKSFRDSTAKPGQAPVLVNGHVLPHDSVKKAEKMAGPIQPGEYWYDRRAGFWGAMGRPCSGIIMPNIEEFNHPLPRNCAAGNTGVFVNGRELHQQDLDLLANRGLPMTRGRSYLVEITGEVVDERTGEELDPLGKLAPTVENAGRGFGMKVPKAVQ